MFKRWSDGVLHKGYSMKSEITLANQQGSLVIPATAKTHQDIVQYARQLTKREVQQIVEALDAGNYEMGALFLWQKTMTGLKKQFGLLGMDFVGELLDRHDITADSGATQVLTDYDAVRLAEELGMFSPTQAMRLRNVLQMVAHFSESPAEEDEDEDRQMMPEEALQCLRTCVQSVLGHERLGGATEFAKFRRELEEKTFSVDDAEMQSLLASPYFFRRTTLRVLLALAKTAQGAQLEHVLANTNVIVPSFWPELLKPDRWLVGRAYAEVHAEGRKTAATGLRKALLKVQGFDYVPEDLRSRTFLHAAAELQNVHFSLNNFYNEPAAIRALASLGTVIPAPALAQCITAILCVRLGNHYGRSHAAQQTAQEMLSNLSEERWKYYLDSCLPGDEIVLEKLIDQNIATRWNILVTEHRLSTVEVKDSTVRDLVANAARGKADLVVNVAKTLLKRLTTP